MKDTAGRPKPVVVVGIGNVLMSDEGIGVHVVRELAVFCDEFPDVEIVEVGSSLMAVLHAVAFRSKAYVVDCARMGERPGVMRMFSPAEISSRKTQAGFSLHEGDLAAVFQLSRQLGEAPARAVIVGIQPGRVAPGRSLSRALKSRLESYVGALRSELAGRSERPRKGTTRSCPGG